MITQEKLKELLDYNPETGIFINKVTRNSRAVKETIAGNLDPSGYIIIAINKIKYRGHNLAWFYIYGTWPKDQLDHINRIRNDNRISNLREATQKQNVQNRTAFKGFTSKYKGVSWDKLNNKWKTQITINNKKTTLGRFSTELEAYTAYKNKALELHGEFFTE